MAKKLGVDEPLVIDNAGGGPPPALKGRRMMMALAVHLGHPAAVPHDPAPSLSRSFRGFHRLVVAHDRTITCVDIRGRQRLEIEISDGASQGTLLLQVVASQVVIRGRINGIPVSFARNSSDEEWLSAGIQMLSLNIARNTIRNIHAICILPV